MRCGNLKLACVVGACLALLAALPTPCQAGPIIDWLFGNPPAAYGQPIYDQGAAIVPPFGQPAGFARPPFYKPGYGQPAYAQPTFSAPAINYGVPCSPGGQVTKYGGACSPCGQATNYPSTYWQTNRVSTYRPLYPVYAAPMALGYSTFGASAPAAAPYYAPPAPAVSYGPARSPGIVSPGATICPSTSVTAPADRQPSLSPGGLPSSSTVRNFTPAVPAVHSDPPPRLPLNVPAPVKKPANGELRLVPDPDAQPGQDQPNRTPRLLTPRDKTASTDPHESATKPIRWSGADRPASAKAPVSAALQAPAMKPAPAPQANEYDGTGWKSLRP